MRQMLVVITVILALVLPALVSAADTEPPEIEDTIINPSKPTTKDEIEITCNVTDDSGIKSVVLVYSRCSEELCGMSEEVEMKHMEGNEYSVKIGPFSDEFYIIKYYIKTTDNRGNTNQPPDKWHVLIISPSEIRINLTLPKPIVGLDDKYITVMGKSVYDNGIPASNCTVNIFRVFRTPGGGSTPIMHGVCETKTGSEGKFEATFGTSSEPLSSGDNTFMVEVTSSQYSVSARKEFNITFNPDTDNEISPHIPGFQALLLIGVVMGIATVKRLMYARR